ncbi:MAG: hypothetical protein Ctma_1472 [Catillopecten margaritatus gill symbiont]|uniref:DUF397 domain-containing protein n=1 Tax=Catillopecten margaritatus gill symbiont TaxID=3083288 RepID=A0AAU6PIB7_9GAMM
MTNNKQFYFEDCEFKKSSLSKSISDMCVEVAINNDGVGVRDSKDSQKTTLNFTHQEWSAFIKGVKLNEFNE